MRIDAGLRFPFLIFFVVAGLVSVCQADRVNADFVAYSTVASRVLESPASSVTGSWSPLFSWMMIPLLQSGIVDTVAGRIILLMSGFFYISAIHRLATKFFPSDLLVNRLMTRAIMTCATVQAIWFSTYLLDPDLLAAAIVFWYFVVVLDERIASDTRRSFVAGAMIGLAYLAKAYMLPFCLAQFIVFAAANPLFKRMGSATPQSTLRMSSLISMIVGLTVVAGPWITVLSLKYDGLTFTNAGRANHANVGPDSFGKDPLWHPPLIRDYILEPVSATDWSPFTSLDNFRHQIRVVIYNTSNCIGLIPGWLMMTGAALSWWLICRRSVAHSGGPIVWWSALTAAVYCSGYILVNLEARYIIPIVAPLLCLSAAGLVREAVFNTLNGKHLKTGGVTWFGNALKSEQLERLLSLAMVLVTGCFAAVDIYSIVIVAIHHPQSCSIEPFRAIARQLEEAGIPDQLSASDRWHDGLYIAYARKGIKNYLGSPQATDTLRVNEELISNGVQIKFCWTRIENASEPRSSTFTDDEEWIYRFTIVHKSLDNRAVEVYTRRELPTRGKKAAASEKNTPSRRCARKRDSEPVS